MIVQATSADAEVIDAMMREFYAMFEDLHYSLPRSRQALDLLLASPDLGAAYLIELPSPSQAAVPQEGPVGYLVLTYGFSLEFLGRTAWIDEFYVREPFRGRGLGRKALEHVRSACKSKGVRAMFLELDHSNLEAGRLYRDLGFRPRSQYQTQYVVIEQQSANGASSRRD